MVEDIESLSAELQAERSVIGNLWSAAYRVPRPRSRNALRRVMFDGNGPRIRHAQSRIERRKMPALVGEGVEVVRTTALGEPNLV